MGHTIVNRRTSCPRVIYTHKVLRHLTRRRERTRLDSWGYIIQRDARHVVCNTQHDTWPACTLARTRLTAPASRRTGTGCELAALGCRSRYAGLAHTHTLHSMRLDPPAAAARRQRYALGTLTPAIPWSIPSVFPTFFFCERGVFPTLASVAWTRDSRAVVGLLLTAECKWDYWLLQSVSGINSLLQSVSGITGYCRA